MGKYTELYGIYAISWEGLLRFIHVQCLIKIARAIFEKIFMAILTLCGTGHLGSIQAGTGRVGTERVGTERVGIGQIGTRQVDPDETAPGQIGSGHILTISLHHTLSTAILGVTGFYFSWFY